MPEYGFQIGKKFHEDGTAANYPGNTVISDVRPGNPAYDVMRRCRQMVTNAGLGPLFILMPEDSYHMTVIRGLNDHVRTDGYWPAALAKQASIEQADEYVGNAVSGVPAGNGFQMRFDAVRITEEDFRVCLSPADEEQNALIRAYRDAVARALGLRLPGHEGYTFHITLAYTHYLAQQDQQRQLRSLEAEMNDLIVAQPPFWVDPPHVAFYWDMLAFSPARVSRDHPVFSGDRRKGKP